MYNINVYVNTMYTNFVYYKGMYCYDNEHISNIAVIRFNVCGVCVSIRVCVCVRMFISIFKYNYHTCTPTCTSEVILSNTVCVLGV